MMLPAAILLAAPGLTTRLARSLLDNPFAGIHQLSWFDYSLLLPYFGVLAVLSVYGLHRYEIIRTYFKYRKNVAKEPVARFAELPRVTIQLPIYNERYVIERLIDEVTKIEYPKELLQIQVLDDSTDDTHAYAEALCERYRMLGSPSNTTTATNRAGLQSGSAGGGPEDRNGRIRCRLRRRFHSAVDFLLKTDPSLRRPQGGRGANTLELFESRLQLPDGSGGAAARRAFHPRARRALAARAISSISTAPRGFCAGA